MTIAGKRGAVGAGAGTADPLPRDRPRLRVGIFGAPLDTGNLGVSALGLATIEGLARAAPGIECLLFDHGRGDRPLDCGPRARVTRVGCFYSRRFYRRESLPTALLLARWGAWRFHPLLRRLVDLDALLDISGGDSFTDLYGDWRFRAVTAPKELALALRLPLVLLPQTYGPFSTRETARRAGGLLAAARRVWARDPHSLGVVRRLLGETFDPARHRESVDVAFGLPARAPRQGSEIVERIARGAGPLLGLNVSGLLFHREREAQAQYGLAVPYRALAEGLLRRLLAESDARVLLIPHVVSPCTPEEDDEAACRALCAGLPAELSARVAVAPALTDPREVKWLIGRCDWFCGTRMHACIAALSQRVPTLGIAYSDKTAGVFDTAEMGGHVVDARKVDLEDLALRASESLAQRSETAALLAASVPRLLERWEAQFRALVEDLAR